MIIYFSPRLRLLQVVVHFLWHLHWYPFQLCSLQLELSLIIHLAEVLHSVVVQLLSKKCYIYHYYTAVNKDTGLVWFMVFNTTFNNISAILWRSVLVVEKTVVPTENRNMKHMSSFTLDVRYRGQTRTWPTK